MNTTQNQTFHTRIQNILDGQNITDKDKSENIIKLMTSLTNDFATLQFKDKNEFDEFIGKNLGQEMRAVVRKFLTMRALFMMTSFSKSYQFYLHCTHQPLQT